MICEEQSLTPITIVGIRYPDEFKKRNAAARAQSQIVSEVIRRTLSAAMEI